MSSFENINNYNQPKSNLIRMIAFSILSFIILLVSILIPFVGIIGLALITIPSLRLMLEGRTWESILCTIVGSSVFFFFDFKTPFFFMAVLIGVSFVFKYCFTRNKDPFLTITFTSLVFIAILVIYIVMVSVIQKHSIISDFLRSYRDIISTFPQDPIVKSYMNTMGISESQMQSVLFQLKGFLDMIPYLSPVMVIFYVFLSNFISYYWSMVIFRKNGLILKGLPVFKTWDIPWQFIFGFIIGLVLVIIPDFNAKFDFAFDAIGINFLIIFGLLYTVIGFAVLWGIFDNFKISNLWRILIVIAISFFMVLLVLIPIMGILDIWINFRKLERH